MAGIFLILCSYVTGGNSFPEILTQEEEEKYLNEYNNGDISAKNKLIEHNLRLVAHIVKKYAGANQEMASDLISVGTIGLIKGVNTYKTGHKTKLATYAAKCIEKAIVTQNSEKSARISALFPLRLGLPERQTVALRGMWQDEQLGKQPAFPQNSNLSAHNKNSLCHMVFLMIQAEYFDITYRLAYLS